VALALGVWIGNLSYIVLKRRRRIAISNLKIAFAKKFSDQEIQRICRKSFQGLGKNLAEFLQFPQLTTENIWELVNVEGKENLDIALGQGKGAIIFVPHFGNWELTGLITGVLIPNRIKAIVFELRNKRLNQLVWKYRQHLSAELIPKKRAIRRIILALQQNCAIGFFADQDAGDSGVFVDFFGKPASAVRSPMILALKTGAPILFSVCIRQPNNQHLVKIYEPFYIEISKNLEHDVQYNTERLLKILEREIRKYPDQWLWLHNRWKTQPT
jgi:KDO2-lipid IV(A) lauroyltransferase